MLVKRSQEGDRGVESVAKKLLSKMQRSQVKITFSLHHLVQKPGSTEGGGEN